MQTYNSLWNYSNEKWVSKICQLCLTLKGLGDSPNSPNCQKVLQSTT
jgi:hypothetical protein